MGFKGMSDAQKRDGSVGLTRAHVQKRMPHQRKAGETWDYWNEVEIEKPALLAHCDFTYERGREMVERQLGAEETQSYIDGGYRIRIIKYALLFTTLPRPKEGRDQSNVG